MQQRHEPDVRSVVERERLRPGEHIDPAREQQRRGRRGRAPAANGGRAPRGEQAAEGKGGDRRGPADAHDAQARRAGDRTRAGELHDLAAGGPAPSRETAGPEPERRGRIVHRGERDERSSELALAEEGNGKGTPVDHRRERAPRGPVERAKRGHALSRESAPRRPDGAVGLGYSPDGTCQRSILRGQAPREHSGEEGGGERDSDRRQDRASRSAAESHAGEGQGISDPPESAER